MSIWNSAFSVPTSPFFRQIALLSSSKTACMDEKFLCSIMPTYYVPVLTNKKAVISTRYHYMPGQSTITILVIIASGVSKALSLVAYTIYTPAAARRPK